jgi:plastocyanin
VVQVADSVDDVGLGNAMALDKDGVPFISYWGFKQKATGIPVSRPIGAPFIPAVQVSSQAGNGIWTRGAAAQVEDTPVGIYVPYGPSTVKGLKDATATNTNGTDIAIAPDGTMNVVWTSQDGVYFASGSTSFTEEQLFKYGSALSEAGPIGRPSVAVDSDGTPWVAYIVNSAKQEVRVATQDSAGKWLTSVVATLPQCGGCPQPGPAAIVATPDGPVVAFADGKDKAVIVSTAHPISQGGVVTGTQPAWTTQKVASGVSGTGLSATTDKDGDPYLSYYTGDGSVQLATSKGGWRTANVADAAPDKAEGAGNLAETTGVAVDDQGKIWVAWYDGKDDSVDLASGDGSTFTPTLTQGTTDGRYPSLAVEPDGSKVFLTWYVSTPVAQDLRMGIWGSQGGLAIANPSPTVAPSAVAASTASAPPSACPKGGLKLEAPTGAAGAGFAQKKLTAPTNKGLTICFDNQDAGVQHNVDVFDKQGGTSLAKATIVTGPAQTTVDASSLKPGTYFFQCDVHPTTMTGSLSVG